jgi:hypothetical protein
MRQHPAWDGQIVGGYASYWIYQHLGNLSPEELSRDDFCNRVKDSEDAWPVLREFAYNAHRGPDGIRWSYHRELGNTRLLMIDSRGVRVLDENHRSMVPPKNGPGSPRERPEASTTCSSAPRSHSSSAPQCTTSRAGTKACAPEPGGTHRTSGRKLAPLPGPRPLSLLPRLF